MEKKRLTAAVMAAAIITTGCAGGSTETVKPAIATGELTGEITVACYDTAVYRPFLEAAAAQFEQQHPGTSITIDSFSAMPEVQSYEADGAYVVSMMQEDSPQERADYISKTSTELMSGRGADLLAMDVLPAYRYVEAGQLENLSAYMEQDPEFVKADYRENVLDAVTFANGTWFLPLDYSFHYVTYDSTLLNGQTQPEFGTGQAFSTSQLLELGRPLFDGTSKILSAPIYNQSHSESLFHQMFQEQYGSFVDMEAKQAGFSDGKFAEVLDGLEELADQGYVPAALNSDMNAADMIGRAGQESTDRYLFKTKRNLSLMQETWPEDAAKPMLAFSNIDNGIEEDDKIAGIAAGENGTVPFTYDQAYAINTNSTNKELAWAFLKFMLSYEIQASPSMSFGSLPIHNEARVKQAHNLYQMMFTEGSKLSDIQEEALTNYQAAVESLSDQINTYTIGDTTIEDMVSEEVGYFFEGARTAKEVAEVLQNKVGLYLNE